MHPLTKVLVVLAALLSIALAALTIAYTGNAERVRAEFQSERELRQAAQDAAARDMTSHESERTRLRSENDALQAQIAGLTSTIDNLQREGARLMADLQNAQAAGLGVQAKIDQLTATNQTLTTLIAQYRTEVTTLRSNELRYAQREIELSDRASDLSGQLEVAVENNRSLQEQLVSLRDQLASAAAGAGAGSTAAGDTIRPSFPIQARVTSVRTDATGRVLVQIDAGSNDRLRERMELSLVRGNQFLGKVIVQAVDIEESVGRVDFLSMPRTEVRQGDMVMSVIQ
ncbi:MAG: hypothetical protein IBJ10_03490 [Phycisphaerales bacterium]|nr:hypothetical protein [Phycisphaerales bacterium]